MLDYIIWLKSMRVSLMKKIAASDVVMLHDQVVTIVMTHHWRMVMG